METLDLLIGHCAGKQDLGNNFSWAPKESSLGVPMHKSFFINAAFPW